MPAIGICELIGVIGDALDGGGQELIIRGHTDSLPWRNGASVNNLSLSTGRAGATRQELLRSGVAMTRFARIEGVADKEPLIRNNAADPRNRRISVLVLD